MSTVLTGEIRPGVHRPDWSVVTKPAARSVLMGRDRVRSGFSEKWSRGLTSAEDLVWRTVLEFFGSRARPPSVLEIAETVGVFVEQARTALADLQVRDLLALDDSATTIVYSYPFSGLATEHRVELHGRRLHAVCAIDALGVAGMFRTDTTIQSCCRACRTPIEVVTAGNGSALSHCHPAAPVVWYDFAYTQAAAASCCPAIAFFCSDAHLAQWSVVQSRERVGCSLTLDEGLEVGRALFEPVLAMATTNEQRLGSR